MKRAITSAIALFVAALGLAIIAPAPAQADTPGCVSGVEYRVPLRGRTTGQITRLFDTPGVQVYRYDDEYWVGDWVEDGYWDEFGEWVDLTYWDDFAYLQDDVDTVRSYKKCRSFDGGRGRVGVNFDNYTSPYSGLRVYSKTRYSPSSIFPFARTLARTADPMAGKPKPARPTKADTPKPESTPGPRPAQ
jgi:hypothetical protein